MNHRKSFIVFTSVALLALVLAACGGGNASAPAGEPAQGTTPPPAAPAAETPASEAPAAGDARWADGVYYAEAADFDEKSGWKEIIAIRVEGGNLTSVNWNGLHRDGGLDKKTSSAAGKYGMVAKGGASAEWHEQAALAEQLLVETQDPAAIAVKDDGTTDAVSGVTIGVDSFVTLADAALSAGPVAAGPYKDGYYRAEEPEFDAKSGWKYTVDIAVMNGKIVAADWNGVHKDGGDDKDAVSKSGEYGLVAKGGAQSEWHEQALKAENYLIETQDPTAITYTDDQGHTDAISGVSIHVVEFFDLAQQALEQAK